MSGIFKPKMPTLPEPIKPPTVDDATQAEEELSRLRRRRGLASTFLLGKTSRTGSAAQSLLGSNAVTGQTMGASAGSSGSTASTGSKSAISTGSVIER